MNCQVAKLHSRWDLASRYAGRLVLHAIPMLQPLPPMHPERRASRPPDDNALGCDIDHHAHTDCVPVTWIRRSRPVAMNADLVAHRELASGSTNWSVFTQSM